MPHGLQIWAVYAALNALLMFGLALNVGLRRGAQKQLQPGDMGDAVLTRAIRAHANFAEYAPLVLLLLLAIALLDGPEKWLHVLGAGFTIGRVFHVFGMMREKHPNAVRFIGNLTTGLALLLGAAGSLWLALGPGTTKANTETTSARRPDTFTQAVFASAVVRRDDRAGGHSKE